MLDSPKIRTIVEYSAADESASMTFYYNGEPYDAVTEGDKLSLAVLRSAVSKLYWQPEQNEGFTNRIRAEIKPSYNN